MLCDNLIECLCVERLQNSISIATFYLHCDFIGTCKYPNAIKPSIALCLL